MVVDTSALVAVLLGESESDSLIALLADAEDPLIAATLVEASIIMRAKTGDDGVADLDRLLAAAAVRCVAVTPRRRTRRGMRLHASGRGGHRRGCTSATASPTRSRG